MTTERRKAPRRKVEGIRRIGAWGDVNYYHDLECGHTDVRPRASRSPRLGCAKCLWAEAKAQELESLNPQPVDMFPEPGPDDAESLRQEVIARETVASLANVLGVPADAVALTTEMRGGHLVVTNAVVFLEANDIRRLLNNKKGGSE